MKMLPTLGKDSTITENGHYLVRPNARVQEPGLDHYHVVNTITDKVENFAPTREKAEEYAIAMTTAEVERA